MISDQTAVNVICISKILNAKHKYEGMLTFYATLIWYVNKRKRDVQNGYNYSIITDFFQSINSDSEED